MTRAEQAGQEMGKAIIEMVHLMYQNNIAESYYAGLSKVICEEVARRQEKGRTDESRTEG